MRIAMIGDLHFQGKKLGDKSQAWEQAVSKILGLEIALVILTGDIFHKSQIGGREASTGTVYRSFMKPTKDLIDAGLGVVAVTGNHDMAGASQLSALEPLADAGIEVIKTWDVNTENEGVVIAYLPWTTDKQVIDNFLETTDKEFTNNPEAYKIVTGHAMISGAVMNGGYEIIGKEELISPVDIAELSADFVGFGHIHKRQNFYIGALSQDNFGDEGNPQGFMVIDTDTKEQKWIDIEAPRYETITSMNDYQPISGNYTKLRLTEKPAEYNELITNDNLSIEIIPERVEVERKVEGIDSNRTMIELLQAYLVARQEVDEAVQRIVKLAETLDSQSGRA